jgi:uncharacterized peroxidase-related enzyme
VALPEYERLAGSHKSLRHAKAANLRIIEESEADGEIAALYQRFTADLGRPAVPGILKCFATHPPLARSMVDLAQNFLFVDGDLIRRHKEMIATLVSSQNACPYCADSHGYAYRMHGGSAESLAAIQTDYLCSTAFNDAERVLLQFVDKVNRSSDQINRADVELLMDAGWSEPQIAEAAHIAALFAAFNRIANAFGLGSQGLLATWES